MVRGGDAKASGGPPAKARQEAADEIAKGISFADDLATRAKALFAPLEENRIAPFIESQAGMGGPVAISNVQTLSDGAGASNGITFFTAEVSGEVLELVVRYAPGIQLIKQKTYEEEFLTLKAAHRAGLPVPRPIGSM